MTQLSARSSAQRLCSKGRGMGPSPHAFMAPQAQQQRAEKSWPGSSAWLASSPKTLIPRYLLTPLIMHLHQSVMHSHLHPESNRGRQLDAIILTKPLHGHALHGMDMRKANER